MDPNASDKPSLTTAPTGIIVPQFLAERSASGPRSSGPASFPHSSSMMRAAPPAPVAVGHPMLDVLRGELERLFALDELLTLTRASLGFEPEQIGGVTAKGSFCRSLVNYCAERDAVEALVDAVLMAKSDVDPRVREIAATGISSADELTPGTEIGPFTVTRKLGEGGAGRVYAATVKEDGATRTVSLKLLRREVARDMRSLQRYLTANRLVGGLSHPSIPKNLASGQLDDGRFFITYDFVDGAALSARLQRTGPMHINEARPILRGVLEALVMLHDKRLAHGDLTTENVLLARSEGAGVAPRVVLLDFGTDRLRARGRAGANQTGVLAVYGSAKAMAPELVRGHVATPKSDVYAFGALLHEVLTGKGLFHKDGASSLEIALAHLSQPPAPPSAVAPRGWVSKEIDAFVLDLVNKDATMRPADARAVLEALDRLGKVTAQPNAESATNATPQASESTAQAAAGHADKPKLSNDDVDLRIADLLEKPGDPEVATALEHAIEEGGDAAQIADGFQQVSEGLDGDDHKELRRGLLFRAARIYEHAAKNPDKAEVAYKRLLDLYPSDEVAQAAYEEMKKSTGQWGDVVEMLLSRVEAVDHGRERALVYAEIGRLYEIELEDPENAFVAFVQAWCEEPREGDYANDVERLAGTSAESWDEALGQATHKVQIPGVSTEDKLALFVKMGAWFISKVNRLDLALPSFQAAVAIEPANDEALEGLCEVYRRAQTWPELGTMLLKRADAAATPARARDLRAQAADLLETKLSDPAKAKEIYQAVVDSDPGHVAATEGLERICARTGDFVGVVKILEARANALRGRERADALAKIGEICEDQIGDMNEAVRRFEAVLAIDARHLGALKGLDRIYNRTGRYKELLANLQSQIEVAATPRQKIGLLERTAAIHDEEFLDHAAAADTYEAILKIDVSHDGALTALVRHYRALDRWEEVANVYERHLKSVEDSGRRVEILIARGRVLSEQVGSPERAMASFEKVLELNSEHAGALEALARLRETAGDANSAVAAVEALAAKASTPQAKAEQYVRAARLLEGRGDKDGAIERYKLALDANPNDKGAATSLRTAYAARGDVAAAIAMIEREVAVTDGKLQKAKLYAEMATIARDRLKDADKARDAAGKALDHDPTNATALTVLGDTAFEAEKYVEAAQRFEAVVARIDSVGADRKDDAIRVLTRFIDALDKTGATVKAIKAVEKLRALAPDDADALRRVGHVIFEHGDPKASREVHGDLIARFSERLGSQERAEVLYRLGESARRMGDLDAALTALDEASDLDPTSAAALDALAKLHEAKGDWAKVVEVKRRGLDLASDDSRVQLMLDLGDVLAMKAGDKGGAAKQYVAALDERPDDRGILLKLMQLYSEAEDWSKLVDVVLRLADFVDEPKAKGKYLMTAAVVVHRQIHDAPRAAELFERVLAADPTNEKALDEALNLRVEQGDDEASERLLRTKLERARKASDRAAQVAVLDRLGELLHRKLAKVDEAIEAYEEAQTLDPEGRERSETLANIYASDAARFLDKAVKSQAAILKRNPYRGESFKLLRRLYTQAKHADSAWCVCQVLTNLGLAEPDEERFFRRHKSETAAPAQDRLTPDDMATSLRHPDRDPLLTAIFATIEPAIVASRNVSLEAEGYHPAHSVDLSQDPYPMSQTLYYAAGVLGLEAPIVFHNRALEAGLAYVHAQPRALVLGRAALETGDLPPQALAFVAAQKLAFFTPGMYVRQLVATGTGLKAWLFGAIKTISPNFPVAHELEGPVRQAIAALALLHPTAKDQLASLVARLLQSGAPIDLKRWIAGCDLSADRAGFVLAHDLEIALALLKASDDGSAGVTVKDRTKELILFASSEDYFALRQKLVIGIDS